MTSLQATLGKSTGAAARFTVQILHSARVLVQLVVFKLDKVVEKAGPRLGVVIVAEVTAYYCREVEEHVPGVARNAAYLQH